MLLVLELFMVQEPSFRDVYSQSNLSVMCIRCFPKVCYLPYLLKITFLYLKYLQVTVNRQAVWVLFYEVLAVTVILHNYTNDET